MADYIRRVLTGDITNLPRKDSNIIRVFTSSTFTDTVEERNRLMRDVYPSLRTYCQQRGLEFQVVDMRWGVRDEATADHKTNELCLQEIKNCQRLTPGPNFVCLLGNKYGYRPFPYKIKATEFEILVQVARETYDQPKHIDSLLEWYWKDTNSIPTEYVLQPITDQFPHYNDLSEANREKYQQERNQWWQIFTSFQRLLKIAARIAFERHLITFQQAHEYFSSVTEEEIECGILGSSNPGEQSLCYIRNISDIDLNLTDKNSKRYTDILEGEHDIEAQDYLSKLKRDRVLQRLGQHNVTQYEVPWSDGGINASDRLHEEYLNNFCKKFQLDVERLIDRSLQHAANEKARQSSLYKEVLHHAWFCQHKCASFRGREDTLNSVRVFLKDFDKREPLVIHGPSGSGKTSIMAVTAKLAKEWLGEGTVCIFRFLGTSPDSSSIRSTVLSVCLQVCEIYNMNPPNQDTQDDFSQLVRFFHGILAKLPVSAAKPFLLILDSVDQLSASNNAHLMNWLLKKCSQFVKIVVSVLPDYYDILPNLRRSLPVESSYIEVPLLTIGMGTQILDNWLAEIGRTLTDEQFELVVSSFSKCPQPLFLKLIFTEASRWASYTNVRGLDLGSNVPQAIRLLFQRLERKHGKTLTSRALGYITAARNGLTENELEDVLSLDDEVIDDVYQYWDPPVEGVIRLPSLLWARIRQDIDEFLTERQADGKTVIAWYHRQFWETAQTCYLSDPQEKQFRHSLLSEYFEGKWAGGRKKHITLTRRKKTIPESDRQVSGQPLMFSKSVFNLRKLSEMPFHLIHSRQTSLLENEVMFNFEWIHGKIQGQSLNDVIEDFALALEVRPEQDVRLIHDTLILASSNIKHDVNCLAPQLLARLLAFGQQSQKIDSLIKQCYGWCYEQTSALFIPQSACLISAGGPLRTNLRGHEQRVNEIVVTSDDKFIATSAEDSLINIWNSSNFDCLHTLRIADKGPSCLVLTPDEKCVIGSSNCAVGIWDIDTGEALRHFHNESAVTCLAVSPDGIFIITGGVDGVVRVWHTGNGKKRKTLSGHEGEINSIVVSSNGDVVTGSQDSTVRKWSLTTEETQAVFKGHSGPILCLVMSRDHGSAISGSEDKTIKIWDLKTRNCATLKGHGGLVKCLATLHDGRRIVSGSKDQSLKIWDLVTLQCCMTLKGHTDLIWRLAVASDDSFVVSASKDDMLRVWNPVSGECKQTLIGHSSWVSCIAITTDCKTIISGSNDKNVKLWHATGTEHACNKTAPSDHIIHHATQPECVAITTNGRWGLSGSKNDSLKLWDISTAKCVKSRAASVACIAVFHKSNQVVTGSHSGDIAMWNCESLDTQRTIRSHQAGVVSLQVSLDDSVIISASNDKTVGHFHVFSGKVDHLIGHSDAVLCIAFMHGEIKAISGSKDKTVRMWNLLTNCCERTFTGHTAAVGCLAATSDHKIIASGSGDFTLRIWSTDSGECLHKLEGHHDSIKCLGITDDNRFVIAGSHEGKDQLLLWDLENGNCARKFTGHTHAVMNLKILPSDGLERESSNDHILMTSSRDGTIKAWNIANGKLINSFDFQSQVKYFDVSPSDDGFSVVLVTKSGTVSVLKFYCPREEKETKQPKINDDSSSNALNHTHSRAKDSPSESCCSVSQCCNCCQKCTLM
ncbi:NACHT domain- and WD repeat-containing protein 1-like [Montipora capricornis]|uniref:NACHT domain- and WD repeat-containing protein 1-like n=1 Tax=Montipora capricornis TaxID=246305 RepID=UPI0035F1CC4B